MVLFVFDFQSCHAVLFSALFVLWRISFSFVLKGWMRKRKRGCWFSLELGGWMRYERGCWYWSGVICSPLINLSIHWDWLMGVIEYHANKAMMIYLAIIMVQGPHSLMLMKIHNLGSWGERDQEKRARRFVGVGWGCWIMGNETKRLIWRKMWIICGWILMKRGEGE